jgi:hypothetical protein
MQAYEVDFAPAQMPPVRIRDGIRAETEPHPHVAVGDAGASGNGCRVPLTSRLAVAMNAGAPLISRAGAYRDPKSGAVVLGSERDGERDAPLALVKLTVSNGFPEGMSITPGKEVRVLARGEARNGRQVLLVWPDGGTLVVEDPVREERHTLRRAGDRFDRLPMESAG